MEDDLDANIIRNTQLSLGKYIKRPPLSEKLLRKPPFRFLHDIITSVLKNTGFFEGLFEEYELTSENVKDRESKISFLNKVISVVSLTTGKPLTVKASKIVAGQEPAKTNELLQCIAQALNSNLSSKEAIQQFQSGVKISLNTDTKSKEPVKPLKKNVESKRLASKSREKLIANEKDGQSINEPKNKENAVLKREPQPKKTLSRSSDKKVTGKSNLVDKKNNASEKKSVSEKQLSSEKHLKHAEQEPFINEKNSNLSNELSLNKNNLPADNNSQKDLTNVTMVQSEELLSDCNESIVKPIPVNESMLLNEEPNRSEINKDTNIDVVEIEKTENEHPHDEPKYKSTNSEDSGIGENLQKDLNIDKKDFNSHNSITPAIVRPSSSRPGAPRIRDKSDVMNDAEHVHGRVNIISENTLNEEEEDTSIIIENNILEDLQETFESNDHKNIVNKNSHLVQQILDSQREFSQTSGKTEIEWQFEAQKPPDIVIQEMEQLKFNVQALSRIANPLGKLLDHIQEDVEVMRQELQQWTQLYEETSKDLLLQTNEKNEALLPFHTKLKQLSVDMEEKNEKIIDLKISIHKNDSRIEKLLTNSKVQ